MTRYLHCTKLNKEAPGFDEPPMPGALGERIFQYISIEAWEAWINHQTMLINEYRLSLIEPKSRVFLLQEMEKFLFGEGSDAPAGYVPTNK